MKTTLAFTAFIAGITLFTACKKEKPQLPAQGAQTVVRITVHDEHGEALGGVPVRIFDEEGYARFKNDHTTQPLDRAVTGENGEVLYQVATGGSKERTRFLSFVILEMQDQENYRVWAVSRTIGREKEVRVEFVIEDDRTELPHLDLFDENNGHTLFGNALYVDAEQHFVGDNRYTIVDLGSMSGLETPGELRLDGFAGRVAARPRHGYFICKDISMQRFPSEKWALSIASEYIRAYVPNRLYNDRGPVGVRLHYTLHRPEGHNLPEWGHVFGVSQAEGAAVTLDLPGDGADWELVARREQTLAFDQQAGHVTVRVTDPQIAWGKNYPFYIRSGVYYTEVSIEITD